MSSNLKVMFMNTTTTQRTVIVTKSGASLSVMERPNGLGSFADYHRKVLKYRSQFAHLLKRQSLDEFLLERKIEAGREWDE